MADETPQAPPPPSTTIPTETELPAPLIIEELESVQEPPLASLEPIEDKLKESLTIEDNKLKESVTVVETETPLNPLPPTTEQHVTVAAALSVPQETTATATESDKDKRKGPESWLSFREESNVLSDLSETEQKALQEFKNSIQEALNTRLFAGPESSDSAQEVSIWGVPLLKDDRSDVVLLKFLRARDFKVKESFTMLKNTMKWRKEFGVDALLEEDLGDDLEKVVFNHGHDKEGHPVCYNVYGEFQNKDLYGKTFGDEEKRLRFLRWRIQFLERSIRKLDFSPGGVNSVFQVTDLKNSPGPGKRELRIATRQALHVLQDNYPEFVAKQVFINVPWWHLAFYTVISPFLTQRTRSKFVFASPARTPETLFKYITPEQVPTQYGGLSVDFCECNPEFIVDDPATEIIVKPATKQTVEIIVLEKCTLVWELRVVGWEVSYSAEFVPNDEQAYTVIIQKGRKMVPTNEPVVSSSFNVTELGKILLTVDNPTPKKKKLLYRYKVVPLPE